MVSGVDESGARAETPAALTALLASLKAEAVASTLTHEQRSTLVVGCDSMLELDGQAYGKPGSAEEAITRIRTMRGRSGILHTGHHVVLRRDGAETTRTAVGSTTVHFAAMSDDDVDAYVATGEPLQVAGSFTIDGLAGAFVRRIEGDPSNVVGISLPLLRDLVTGLGIAWPALWRR